MDLGGGSRSLPPRGPRPKRKWRGQALSLTFSSSWK
jgi:hypothetical protein